MMDINHSKICNDYISNQDQGQSLLSHDFNQVLLFCAYTRPRYQASVYRTIGPLVLFSYFVVSRMLWAKKENNLLFSSKKPERGCGRRLSALSGLLQM